eukprot:TRINITY_DN6564_c0_g1_i3.p1 TRINITY_DN6564_c0_g1~~TRINITY_DN6564_c0_g1_i3.p1  ORF type:complete len:612 (+),score=74.29 TRINITY_DN6564_c0_g1_i3:342-2177(+)
MQDVLFKYYIDMHQILNILVIITLQIRAAVGAERWGSLGLELSLIVGATFKWIHDASQRVLPQQYRTNICCILLTLQALVMMHPSSVAPKFVQDWFVIIFIFGRIPASAVTPSKYIIIYGNVAFLLMALYRFWCDGDPTKSFLEASTAPDKYIMDEVLYGVATVSSALAFQTFLRDRVRHGIMAKTTSSHLHASRSLLGLVCDSVLDLDDDLRFAEDSPQLANLLLRRVAAASKGRSFLDFLHSPEERERVSKLLKMPQETEEKKHDQALAFNTHMQDSWDNKVGVECFQVRVVDSWGCARRLVGMREYEDAFARRVTPDCEDEGAGLVVSQLMGEKMNTLRTQNNTLGEKIPNLVGKAQDKIVKIREEDSKSSPLMVLTLALNVGSGIYVADSASANFQESVCGIPIGQEIASEDAGLRDLCQLIQQLCNHIHHRGSSKHVPYLRITDMKLPCKDDQGGASSMHVQGLAVAVWTDNPNPQQIPVVLYLDRKETNDNDTSSTASSKCEKRKKNKGQTYGPSSQSHRGTPRVLTPQILGCRSLEGQQQQLLGPTLLAGLSGGLLAAPSLSEQKLPSSGQGAGSNSSDHSSDSIDGLDSMSADLREARKIQSL